MCRCWCVVKISQPRNMQNGWLSRQRCSGSSKLLWHTPGRCVLHRSKFHPDLAVSAIPQAAFSIAPARPQDVKEAQRVLLNERMNFLGVMQQNMLVAVSPGTSAPAAAAVPPGQQQLLGFVQLKPVRPAAAGQPSQHELSSLYVYPQSRNQGVGSALLQAATSRTAGDIYLTTLQPTAPFYARAGFQVLPLTQIPGFMLLEAAAGLVVARLAVQQQLVVMRRPALG